MPTFPPDETPTLVIQFCMVRIHEKHRKKPAALLSKEESQELLLADDEKKYRQSVCGSCAMSAPRSTQTTTLAR